MPRIKINSKYSTFKLASKSILFAIDCSGFASDLTTTLGRGQWESPFFPSPILVVRPEGIPLKSRFSSKQVDCLGVIDPLILLQLLFKELFGPLIEVYIVGLLNCPPTIGVFFSNFGHFCAVRFYTSILNRGII